MTEPERAQTASDVKRSRTRGEGTPVYDQLAAEQERRAREQQEVEG
ncbi:hypothetical protein [Microbacterium kunmingense]|nr:hypothetical protein [Microbacterium kunmingense]